MKPNSIFNYIAKLFIRIIDFLLRKRTIARYLISAGSTIIVAVLASGWALGILYEDTSRTLGFNLKTTDSLPIWAILGAFFLGLILIILGTVIGVLDWRAERETTKRSKSIIIELRGLHSSPDTPALAVDLGLPKAQSDSYVVDFRPSREGELVDPELALEKIQPVKRYVESISGKYAKQDITLALGGLAAVPFLFLLGMLFDDESNIVIYDWDRSRKSWRLVDDLDDEKRLIEPSSIQLPIGTQEVIVAISASYPVDELGLSSAFGSEMGIVHLRAEEMLIDRLWSTSKQQAYVLSFRDTVQKLIGLGVKKIHLVLAAPASLAIRMGMAYDRRLMPDLIVYQYERTSEPPYPWGLRMPTHGQINASVEWN